MTPRTSIEQTARVDRTHREVQVFSASGDQTLRFDGKVDEFVRDSDSVFPVQDLRALSRFLKSPEVQEAIATSKATGQPAQQFVDYGRASQLTVAVLPGEEISIQVGQQSIQVSPSAAQIVSKSLMVEDQTLITHTHTLQAKATATGYRSTSEEYVFSSRSPIWG